MLRNHPLVNRGRIWLYDGGCTDPCSSPLATLIALIVCVILVFQWRSAVGELSVQQSLFDQQVAQDQVLRDEVLRLEALVETARNRLARLKENNNVVAEPQALFNLGKWRNLLRLESLTTPRAHHGANAEYMGFHSIYYSIVHFTEARTVLIVGSGPGTNLAAATARQAQIDSGLYPAGRVIVARIASSSGAALESDHRYSDRLAAEYGDIEQWSLPSAEKLLQTLQLHNISVDYLHLISGPLPTDACMVLQTLRPVLQRRDRHFISVQNGAPLYDSSSVTRKTSLSGDFAASGICRQSADVWIKSLGLSEMALTSGLSLFVPLSRANRFWFGEPVELPVHHSSFGASQSSDNSDNNNNNNNKSGKDWQGDGDLDDRQLTALSWCHHELLSTQCALVHSLRGAVAFRDRHFDDAASAFRLAVVVDPDSIYTPVWLRNEAVALERSGQKAKARQLVEQAQTQAGFRSHLELAFIYRDLDRKYAFVFELCQAKQKLVISGSSEESTSSSEKFLADLLENHSPANQLLSLAAQGAGKASQQQSVGDDMCQLVFSQLGGTASEEALAVWPLTPQLRLVDVVAEGKAPPPPLKPLTVAQAADFVSWIMAGRPFQRDRAVYVAEQDDGSALGLRDAASSGLLGQALTAALFVGAFVLALALLAAFRRNAQDRRPHRQPFSLRDFSTWGNGPSLREKKKSFV